MPLVTACSSVIDPSIIVYSQHSCLFGARLFASLRSFPRSRSKSRTSVVIFARAAITLRTARLHSTLRSILTCGIPSIPVQQSRIVQVTAWTSTDQEGKFPRSRCLERRAQSATLGKTRPLAADNTKEGVAPILKKWERCLVFHPSPKAAHCHGLQESYGDGTHTKSLYVALLLSQVSAKSHWY